jgi:hypothetical protein
MGTEPGFLKLLLVQLVLLRLGILVRGMGLLLVLLAGYHSPPTGQYRPTNKT